MADDCIFCGCTAGWHNTPGSKSKPAQNKQRQSTWCLWMPLYVKCLERRLRLKRLLSALGLAASHVTGIDLKTDRGRSNIAGVWLENNSLVTLLPSNYAKTDSLVPTFKTEGEPAIDAHHSSFNITHRIAIPTWDVNKTISCHWL